MDGFTIVDGGVAAVIIISAILAFSRGFVREAMAIVGWIIAALVAFTFAGAAEPLIKEIPYVGNFIGESCELAILAAFAVVFAAALLLSSLFTPLLSSAIKNSVLGPIDAIAGFLFGVARGVLLVAVGFLVLDRVTTEGAFPMVDDSRSAAVFERAQSGLEAQIPTNAPDWILVRYNQLVGECGPGQQPSTATDATTGS